MRTKVSYLAEKLASGELSACQALDKCIDIDRARDVFELADLLKYLQETDFFDERQKQEEIRDSWNRLGWQLYPEVYFADSVEEVFERRYQEDEYWDSYWSAYAKAEQERLAPSDREIQIGKIARDLAVKHHNGSLKRNPYELGFRFCNEYKLTTAEQAIFWNEYTDYNYHINCGYRYEF